MNCIPASANHITGRTIEPNSEIRQERAQRRRSSCGIAPIARAPRTRRRRRADAGSQAFPAGLAGGRRTDRRRSAANLAADAAQVAGASDHLVGRRGMRVDCLPRGRVRHSAGRAVPALARRCRPVALARPGAECGRRARTRACPCQSRIDCQKRQHDGFRAGAGACIRGGPRRRRTGAGPGRLFRAPACLCAGDFGDLPDHAADRGLPFSPSTSSGGGAVSIPAPSRSSRTSRSTPSPLPTLSAWG